VQINCMTAANADLAACAKQAEDAYELLTAGDTEAESLAGATARKQFERVKAEASCQGADCQAAADAEAAKLGFESHQMGAVRTQAAKTVAAEAYAAAKDAEKSDAVAEAAAKATVESFGEEWSSVKDSVAALGKAKASGKATEVVVSDTDVDTVIDTPGEACGDCAGGDDENCLPEELRVMVSDAASGSATRVRSFHDDATNGGCHVVLQTQVAAGTASSMSKTIAQMAQLQMGSGGRRRRLSGASVSSSASSEEVPYGARPNPKYESGSGGDDGDNESSDDDNASDPDGQLAAGGKSFAHAFVLMLAGCAAAATV
jgi:hypothetical protein